MGEDNNRNKTDSRDKKGATGKQTHQRTDSTEQGEEETRAGCAHVGLFVACTPSILI